MIKYGKKVRNWFQRLLFYLFFYSVPRSIVTDSVNARLRSYTTPYTTVFWRITWSSITVVYLRDRIRSYTEKNGGRERSYLDPYTVV